MPGTASHASGASSSNVSENYMRVPHDRQPHGPGPGHPVGAARVGALEKPAAGIPTQHASALSAAYGSPVAAAPIAPAQPINSREPRPGGHSIGAGASAATAVQNSPPADLVDLGLNEDSAVLAPIAMQEEEPVRIGKTNDACNADNACIRIHQSKCPLQFVLFLLPVLPCANREIHMLVMPTVLAHARCIWCRVCIDVVVAAYSAELVVCVCPGVGTYA